MAQPTTGGMRPARFGGGSDAKSAIWSLVGLSMVVAPIVISHDSKALVGAAVGVVFATAAVLVAYRQRNDTRRDRRGRPIWVGVFLAIAVVIGVPIQAILGGGFGLGSVGGTFFVGGVAGMIWRRLQIT